MIEFYGFLFISIFGSLSHFLYNWSNENKYAAVFFAVNESVWEHMKLVVFPVFVWIIIEIPFLYDNPNFIVAKFLSLIIMLILIPSLYYLYIFLFKKHNVIFSIFEFLLSIALGQYISYIVLKSNSISNIYSYISLILLIIIFSYFLIATLIPGKSDIFVDPITNKKGIIKNTKK